TYASFGAARGEDLFTAGELRQARQRRAQTFASAIARNNGNGTFTLHALPVEAQLAAVYAAVAGDLGGAGHSDRLLGGHLFGMAPVVGRTDASYGLVLRGNGDGGFRAVDMAQSGLMIAGQVRRLRTLRLAGGGRGVVVARNNDRLELLRLRR